MDIELITKLLTVAGSVFALYKVIAEFVIARKPRLREEFKFVKEFIGELNASTHPYVVEKGYLAVSGDASLCAQEITHLLSLRAPGKALENYALARKYLQFRQATDDQKASVTFREKYTARRRRYLKLAHLSAYGIFATLAFAPIPFARDIFGSQWQMGIVVILMALLSFGPLAWSSLTEYGRLLRGEELVEQH